MKNILLSVLCLSVSACAGLGVQEARSVLSPAETGRPAGEVVFTRQADGTLYMEVSLSHLPPGQIELHITHPKHPPIILPAGSEAGPEGRLLFSTSLPLKMAGPQSVLGRTLGVLCGGQEAAQGRIEASGYWYRSCAAGD